MTVLALALLFAVIPPAQAGSQGPWLETGHLAHVAPHVGLGSSQTDFGTAVAIDGDTAVVGAPYLDTAFVYERVDGLWAQTAELTGPAGFGEQLDVTEGVIAVAAPDASLVRVFELVDGGDWALTSTLTHPGTACLGDALSMEDGLIVAGDPCGSHSIHVFSSGDAGWSWDAELSIGADDRFGRAVGVSGSTVLAGGEGVYTFDRSGDGWSAGVTVSEESGSAVALDGDVAAAATRSGVLVFERLGGSWLEVSRLTSEDASPFDGSSSRFGWSIDLAPGTLVVGAPKDDPSPGVFGVDELAAAPCIPAGLTDLCPEQEPGAVYVFEQLDSDGDWVQAGKLTSRAATGEFFGRAVAIDGGGDTIIAGSHGHPQATSGFADLEDAGHVFSRALEGVVP